MSVREQGNLFGDGICSCLLASPGLVWGNAALVYDLDRLECLSVLFSFNSDLAINALEDILADHLIENFVFA